MHHKYSGKALVAGHKARSSPNINLAPISRVPPVALVGQVSESPYIHILP